jgi:hypothetical protein
VSSCTSDRSSATLVLPMALSPPRGRPNSTFRASERQGNRRGSWNAIAHRSSMPLTGVPSIVSVPVVGVSRPTICLSNVDFPHPDGPSKTTISPVAISRSMSRSTCRVPPVRVPSPKERPMPSSTTRDAGTLVLGELTEDIKARYGDLMVPRLNRRNRTKRALQTPNW